MIVRAARTATAPQQAALKALRLWHSPAAAVALNYSDSHGWPRTSHPATYSSRRQLATEGRSKGNGGPVQGTGASSTGSSGGSRSSSSSSSGAAKAALAAALVATGGYALYRKRNADRQQQQQQQHDDAAEDATAGVALQRRDDNATASLSRLRGLKSNIADGSHGGSNFNLSIDATDSGSDAQQSGNGGVGIPIARVSAQGEGDLGVAVGGEGTLEEPREGVVELQSEVTAHVFFDLASEGTPLGRVLIGLYGTAAPRTCANFMALTNGCTVLRDAWVPYSPIEQLHFDQGALKPAPADQLSVERSSSGGSPEGSYAALSHRVRRSTSAFNSGNSVVDSSGSSDGVGGGDGGSGGSSDGGSSSSGGSDESSSGSDGGSDDSDGSISGGDGSSGDSGSGGGDSGGGGGGGALRIARAGTPMWLHYKGTPLHTIEPGIQVRGGDVINRDGTGGHSIYGPLFPDENLKLRHLSEGVISMANAGPDSSQSQFVITLAPTPWMDGSHVVFGTVLEGMQTLHRVAQEFGPDSKTDKVVSISDCGVITAHASAAEEESIERSTPAMVMDLIHEDIKEIRKAKAAAEESAEAAAGG